MRNIRIGVVEDDPASCQLVLDYLNRYQQENDEQFTVSVFDDGARIVEKYTPVFDILLLDIEMSEMDGMAAAKRIRERDDKVVIVFITAAPQYDQRVRGARIVVSAQAPAVVRVFTGTQEVDRHGEAQWRRFHAYRNQLRADAA